MVVNGGHVGSRVSFSSLVSSVAPGTLGMCSSRGKLSGHADLFLCKTQEAVKDGSRRETGVCWRR